MRAKNLNNKGVALVTVVLFFLVLVILLGGVMFSSISNQGNAMLSKEHTSAYYTAESGMNISLEKLKDYLISNSYGNIPYSQFNQKMTQLENYILNDIAMLSGSLNGSSPSGNYQIDAVKIDSKNYTIRSTGEVNGVSRTLEAVFKLTVKEEDLMKAVLVKGSITQASNSNITGPIASLMEGNSKIDVHGCGIDEISVPTGTPSSDLLLSNFSTCPTTINYFDETINFDTVRIDDFYPGQPEESLRKTTITPKPTSFKPLVNNSGTYTFPDLGTAQAYSLSGFSTTSMIFDLGSGSEDDVHKVFVTTASTGNGEINVPSITVVGDGELQLFITLKSSDLKSNKIIWKGNVNQDLTNLTKLQLIIDQTTGLNPTFEFPSASGGSTSKIIFKGSIFADNVNFTFGNMDFRGFLATNGTSVFLSSTGTMDGPIWIYAPNATVTVKANFTIEGAIIAKEASFEAGGSLKYESFFGDLPEDITIPLFNNGAPVPVGITYEFINFKEV